MGSVFGPVRFLHSCLPKSGGIISELKFILLTTLPKTLDKKQPTSQDFTGQEVVHLLFWSHWFLGFPIAKQGFSMWYRDIHLYSATLHRPLNKSQAKRHIFFYSNFYIYQIYTWDFPESSNDYEYGTEEVHICNPQLLTPLKCFFFSFTGCWFSHYDFYNETWYWQHGWVCT